jgi:hypothetical protein
MLRTFKITVDGKPYGVTAEEVSETPRDVSQAHIAAITAAVCAILGAHRIVHIQDMGRGTSWTTGGRMMHQTSHQPTRNH